MNPFDILTEILNAGAGAQQPQGGGQRRQAPSGADILKDILGGSAPSGRDNSTSGGVQFPGSPNKLLPSYPKPNKSRWSF
ncbi:MAG: hypothetical protein LW699_02060 [Pirellula sp.]|nr:hypothetical protein [Pirellula sp.]